MKKLYIDHYGIDCLPNLSRAAHIGAEYFVTTCEALLLDKEELQAHYKIKILTPAEFINKLERNEVCDY